MRAALLAFVALASCDYMAFTFPGTRYGCGARYACTDNAATDPDTGLSWMRTYKISDSWDDAKAKCEGLNADGHQDWRLPTINELATVHDPTFDLGYDETVFGSNGIALAFSSETEGPNVRMYSWEDMTHDKSSVGMECAYGGFPQGPVLRGKACLGAAFCVRGP